MTPIVSYSRAPCQDSTAQEVSVDADWIAAAVLVAAVGMAPTAQADPLSCNLSGYKAAAGLTAADEPVGSGGIVPTGNVAIGPHQNLAEAPAAAAAGGAAAAGAAPAGGGQSDDVRLKGQEMYYEMARLQSRKDFLVIPDEEFNIPGADRANQFGGHNDMVKS